MEYFHCLCTGTLLFFTLNWFYIYHFEESIVLNNSKIWIGELGIKLLVNRGLCEKRKSKGIKAICSQTGELFWIIYNTAAVTLKSTVHTDSTHTNQTLQGTLPIQNY